MNSPEKKQFTRQVVTITSIVVVAIIVMAAWSTLRRSFSRFAGDFLYPYIVSSRVVVHALSDKTLLFFSRYELAQQLELLREENRHLAAQAASAAELLVANSLLRQTAKLAPPPSWRYINGEIILRDPRYWNRRITIDRGSLHGVVSGAAAIAMYEGKLLLVGVVDKVNRRSSEIITISNHTTQISAYLPQSRTIGVINANLEHEESLEHKINIGFLPIDGTYLNGESIVTSGFEPKIPAGIIIGTLKGVLPIDSRFSHKLYQQGEVVPAIDLSNIRFVVIADRVDVEAEAEL